MKRRRPIDFIQYSETAAELKQRLAEMSDEELEAIVGYDAVGLRLRAMTIEQLEALADPLVSALGRFSR